MLPLTPRAFEERTTRIERASPEWSSGALPSELRPPSGTPGWSQTSGLYRRRAALCSLSYGRVGKEPPAGVEPAPRPYKGRVLPLTLRRQDGDGGSRTRSSSVQMRCSAVKASSPDGLKGRSRGWPERRDSSPEPCPVPTRFRPRGRARAGGCRPRGAGWPDRARDPSWRRASAASRDTWIAPRPSDPSGVGRS